MIEHASEDHRGLGGSRCRSSRDRWRWEARPHFHGSPRAARVRWAAAGLLIVLALSAIAALAEREARFERPGPEGTAPGSQALSNSLGPEPASLAAEAPAIALPAETHAARASRRRRATRRRRLREPAARLRPQRRPDRRAGALLRARGGLRPLLHRSQGGARAREGRARPRARAALPRRQPEGRARGSRSRNRKGQLPHGLRAPHRPAHLRALVYRELWPGIDMAFQGEGGKLRYEFRLRPGAEASDIRLAYAGAEDVSLGAGGALRIDTPLGALRDAPPQSFQRIDGRRVPVESRYALAGDSYGFSVGRHDRGRPLVIDPSLAYSTYLGGSSSTTGLVGVAVDSAGAAYVTGDTISADFPTTAGAFDTSASGELRRVRHQAQSRRLGPFLLHLPGRVLLRPRPRDRGRLGGGRLRHRGHRLRGLPDHRGGLRHQRQRRLPTPFVTKLNPAGSGLSYSTFLGGSYLDQGLGVAVDSAGAAYVTGETVSADFPTTAGAFDTSSNGEPRRVRHQAQSRRLGPFLLHLPGRVLLDVGRGVAVDSAGAAYVAGDTAPRGLPHHRGGLRHQRQRRPTRSSPSSTPPARAFPTPPSWAGPPSTKASGSRSTRRGPPTSPGSPAPGTSRPPRGPSTPAPTASSTRSSPSSIPPARAFPTPPSWAGPPSTRRRGRGRLGGGRLRHRVHRLRGLPDHRGGLRHQRQRRRRVRHQAQSRRLGPFLLHLPGRVRDFGSGIAVDSAGAAYVTGVTSSTDFPTTAGAFDTSANGDGTPSSPSSRWAPASRRRSISTPEPPAALRSQATPTATPSRSGPTPTNRAPRCGCARSRPQARSGRSSGSPAPTRAPEASRAADRKRRRR